MRESGEVVISAHGHDKSHARFDTETAPSVGGYFVAILSVPGRQLR